MRLNSSPRSPKELLKTSCIMGLRGLQYGGLNDCSCVRWGKIFQTDLEFYSMPLCVIGARLHLIEGLTTWADPKVKDEACVFAAFQNSSEPL